MPYLQIGESNVSIHAPVRVRLKRRNRTTHQINVSIHAPVRVRLGEMKNIAEFSEFQFTHP